jgi:hypothetical protein
LRPNQPIAQGPLPTKIYGKRTVVIPGFVRELLEDHLKAHVGRAADSLVFTAPEEGPLRYSNFRRRSWNPAVIEPPSCHRASPRTTYAIRARRC